MDTKKLLGLSKKARQERKEEKEKSRIRRMSGKKIRTKR